ncbi:S1 RNA-binding domain-containing protein [Metamycoplasma canadense]|uniref:S1 RNA binding domain protein n=1 Tax=Metamycoplasma canadense TaxID=29554 RepID=A0A077L5G7_9BACT|nr:S1 RNA-binding domain-containing protein [Metamycoplasma canadense]BAP39505.1 S1 RNA binding domain protein [Metamycoplasma canadense]
MSYSKGQIIKAKVIRVSKKVISFITKDSIICYLNIHEVSDYFVSDLNLLFKINDIKEVKIIEIMPNGELILSYKQIHPKELRNPFRFKLDKKNNKFSALLDFTNKGINYGN